MRVATRRSERGLVYADDIKDNRGSVVEVHESSAADDYYLWLEVETSALYYESCKVPGHGISHLNREQAEALGKLLLRFARTGRLQTKATRPLDRRRRA